MLFPLPRFVNNCAVDEQTPWCRVACGPDTILPRGNRSGAQALRWCFTALTTIELPILSQWFVDMSGGKGSKPSEALGGWGEMRLKQLDGWLAERQFIATDEFTVADILMTHVLDAGTRPEMLAACPNLRAYVTRNTERSAWRKTVEAYDARVEAA